MLPKSKRLPSYLILKVLKKGGKSQNQLASIFVLSSKEKITKFAFLVPIRLSKKAVKRNKTRRLLIETVSKNYEKIRDNLSVILMAKKIFEKEKLQDVEPEIIKLLEKGGIIKTK